MFSQLPNLLTIARIAACPVLVLLLNNGDYVLSLIVCLVAGITDGMDGFIAKKFNLQTELGAILDPIADKLLIASVYVMLAIIGDIPFWLLILVTFRDLVIIVGYLILLLLDEVVSMSPTYLSKVNTFMQIMLMLLVLVDKATGLNAALIMDTMIILVSITTTISGCHYVWQWGIRGRS